MLEAIPMLAIGLASVAIIAVAFVPRVSPTVKMYLSLTTCVACLIYFAGYTRDTDYLGIAALHAPSTALWLAVGRRQRR